MNKLIALEFKRNRIKSYQKTVIIISITLLGLLYLMAAIPKLDPAEAEMGMILSYKGIINLNHILSMSIFLIFASVLYSKCVVEEYIGKKAILILS